MKKDRNWTNPRNHQLEPISILPFPFILFPIVVLHQRVLAFCFRLDSSFKAIFSYSVLNKPLPLLSSLFRLHSFKSILDRSTKALFYCTHISQIPPYSLGKILGKEQNQLSLTPCSYSTTLLFCQQSPLPLTTYSQIKTNFHPFSNHHNRTK